MARVTETKIEFTSPATVGELLDALEDLRAQAGPDVPVRVGTFLNGLSLSQGAFVRHVTTDKPASGKGVTA